MYNDIGAVLYFLDLIYLQPAHESEVKVLYKFLHVTLVEALAEIILIRATRTPEGSILSTPTSRVPALVVDAADWLLY